MRLRLIIYFLLLSVITFPIYSQNSDLTSKDKLPFSDKFSLGTDLVQPFLLGGFNINASYTTERLIFDYSHGFSLSIKESLQSDEQKSLEATIEVPWTTGPGFGYRITKNLDARVDFKIHKTDINLLNGFKKFSYFEYTAGPGVFYRFYFGKKSNFGLEVSIRQWFNLGNDLKEDVDNVLTFDDSNGQERRFETNVSSGFGANIALIYTFKKND